MMITQGLLFAVVSVAGFGGPLMASAHAAAFICPDTTAASMPGTAPSSSGLYSGADDITASNRLNELVAELRKSSTKPALTVDVLRSPKPSYFGSASEWIASQMVG